MSSKIDPTRDAIEPVAFSDLIPEAVKYYTGSELLSFISGFLSPTSAIKKVIAKPSLPAAAEKEIRKQLADKGVTSGVADFKSPANITYHDVAPAVTFHLGPDGKLRFQSVSQEDVDLSKVLKDHTEAAKNIAPLNSRIIHDPSRPSSYNRQTRDINIVNHPYFNAREILEHELSHAANAATGGPRGSSVGYELQALLDELDSAQLGKYLNSEAATSIPKIDILKATIKELPPASQEYATILKQAYSNYLHSGGEQEAELARKLYNKSKQSPTIYKTNPFQHLNKPLDAIGYEYYPPPIK